MKILSIFNKNLKTISRSPSYFIILFLCPLILIFIAGVMLNSIGVKNVRVGIVGYTEINISAIKNIHYYTDLPNCISDLKESKINVCIYSPAEYNGKKADIYIDNSHRVVQLYTRQFILENLLDLQTDLFMDASGEINQTISVYYNSIADVRKSLINAQKELDEQEKLLLDYQKNLSDARSTFNEIYYPILALRNNLAEIKRESTNFSPTGEILYSNISNARQSISEAKTKLNNLNQFLSVALLASDYNYANNIINDLNKDLDKIDRDLKVIALAEEGSNEIIKSLNLTVEYLDQIDRTLNKLDSDLNIAIDRTREGKKQINSFLIQLNYFENDLNSIKKRVDSSGFSFNIEDIFNLPEDPVSLVYPILITLIMTFTALVLSNMFILKEVNQESYLREIISPARDINFLVADYLINFVLVLSQTSVFFLIGVYWFKIPFLTFLIYSSVILLASSIFVLWGMSIGYVVKKQSLSMLLAVFVVMFLVIFSDFLAPSILASPIIGFFINLNPFMILKSILTSGFLLGKSFNEVYGQIIILVFFFIVSFIVAYISKKISKKKL